MATEPGTNDFTSIGTRALKVRIGYVRLNPAKSESPWTAAERLPGLVGDLAKLIMARNGICAAENLEATSGHDLADCRWPITVLADELNSVFEPAFSSTMEELDLHITRSPAEY